MAERSSPLARAPAFASKTTQRSATPESSVRSSSTAPTRSRPRSSSREAPSAAPSCLSRLRARRRKGLVGERAGSGETIAKGLGVLALTSKLEMLCNQHCPGHDRGDDHHEHDQLHHPVRLREHPPDAEVGGQGCTIGGRFGSSRSGEREGWENILSDHEGPADSFEARLGTIKL